MDNHKTKQMKIERSKQDTKLSMNLTAQVQARILSKAHTYGVVEPALTTK